MPIMLLQAGQSSTNMPFLFAAFAVSWAVFFLYAFFVARRQQELRKEIQELREIVEEQEPGGG